VPEDLNSLRFQFKARRERRLPKLEDSKKPIDPRGALKKHTGVSGNALRKSERPI
jgi:hypothetical protein